MIEASFVGFYMGFKKANSRKTYIYLAVCLKICLQWDINREANLEPAGTGKIQTLV